MVTDPNSELRNLLAQFSEHGNHNWEKSEWFETNRGDEMIEALSALIARATRQARLIELDLLEQAVNDGRDINEYKMQRLKALLAALDSGEGGE